MENEGQIYCHSEEKDGQSENSFTIIWKIESSEFFYEAGHKLLSPAVFVDVMEGTGWRLVLTRLQPEKGIYVTVKRESEDHGLEQFYLNYEFETTLTEEGGLKNEPRSHVFRKNEFGPHILLCTDENTSCKRLWAYHTIRCVMKKNNRPISMSCRCYTRTRIAGECFEFIAKVENFNAFKKGSKRTLKVLSSSSNEELMTVVLRRDGVFSEYYMIDIIPKVEKCDYRYTFSCSILDFLGNKTKLHYHCENTLQTTETLDLETETYFETYAEYYLQNGTLSLLCKLTLLTGIQYEAIEEYEVSLNDEDQKVYCSSQDSGTSIAAAASASSSSYENDPKLHGQSQNISGGTSKRNDGLSNPFPAALEDMASFYKKGILCDAKLQTATETFPVHKAILSARSPVFESMFTSDMKEKIEECVHIDDVDAETLKRMLLFLYSDSLEELKWEDAKKLYFAADKYQVLSLKYRCTVILKKSIDLSNCCELLLLADMHLDQDLKAGLQNYIARHDREVFLNDRWRDMEKNHPLLAIEIFRAIHIK